MGDRHSLLQQLKQRHVVRAALIYAAAVWALAQGIAQLSPVFGLSAKVTLWFVIACVIGFPFWIAFAWFYKFTPHGIAREDDAAKDDAAARRAGRKLDYWIIGIMALAIVLLLTNELVLQRGKTIHEFTVTASAPAALASVPIPAKSVAVLPFENLSADKNNAYFADGIQDLILTKLADIGDLKVIARTSTESYGSHPQNLTKVGKQLGVATILEGSVQKAGQQVLINVQLIDAKTDSHIWAHSYTRTLDNIFGVEGEVADKVAHALNATLTRAETSRVAAVPTHDPKAYNDYLRATHLDNEAAKGGKITYIPKAIAAYKQAVKQDPTFALAWAGLSSERTTARYWGVDSSRHNLLEAGAAAARALTLAPNLSEAHLAMAGVQRFLYHNIEAARAEDQRAVQLRPNGPDALEDLAINDWILGKTKASRKTLRRLIALEPTQSFPVMSLGLFQALESNYPAARRALKRGLAIDPQGAEGYALLSRVDVLSRGDVNAATALLNHMPPGTPKNLHVATQRIRLLLYRRDFAGARRLAAQFSTRFDKGTGPVVIGMNRANIEWLAGDKKAAQGSYRKVIALLAGRGFDMRAANHVDLAVAYARLGNAHRAMQELHAAETSAPHAQYADSGFAAVAMAKIQLALGHKTKAINALRKAMAQPVPGFLSVHVLRRDPTWDPIRHNPAFQALLKKYGNSSPANASTAVPATTP